MGVKSFKPTNITEGVHLGQGFFCLKMKAKEKGEPQAMDVASVIAASINRLLVQTSPKSWNLVSRMV